MADRRLDEPHRRLAAARRGLAQAFWVLSAGVIVAYVFFVSLGAFGSGEVVAVTVAVAVLAVLWIAHGLLDARRRRRGVRDERLIRARERRGF